MNYIITHTDNKTKVCAVIEDVQDCLYFIYQIGNIIYSRAVTFLEGISLGIFKCTHHSVLPIMGFDNVVTGEQCLDCGKII